MLESWRKKCLALFRIRNSRLRRCGHGQGRPSVRGRGLLQSINWTLSILAGRQAPSPARRRMIYHRQSIGRSVGQAWWVLATPSRELSCVVVESRGAHVFYNTRPPLPPSVMTAGWHANTCRMMLDRRMTRSQFCHQWYLLLACSF